MPKAGKPAKKQSKRGTRYMPVLDRLRSLQVEAVKQADDFAFDTPAFTLLVTEGYAALRKKNPDKYPHVAP